jgi:gliding motility-associated-like protein
MKWLQAILFFSFICCNTIFVSAQITVDDSKSAKELVENILVNSSCASVTTFYATGDNNVPIGTNSYGFFTNAGGSFPFIEGVLLSTQYAQKSIGPYSFVVGNDNDGAWSGDSDLNQILGISSVNATILEFDFKPLTNFLSFDYIFSSTEYAGAGSCSFTDAFAFLIKENSPASVYQNLAVIPGTTIAVSSTNVRPAIPPSGTSPGCPAVNQEYFNGFNGSTSPINYAGQTVVMNAQTDVIIGKSYHIKLVIANDKNEFYDSAVFLKAGSFAPKINLGSDRVFSNSPICSGESYSIDTKLPVSYDYKWYKDGSSIPIQGETSPVLNVTSTGTYKVEVIFTPATCLATDEITIEFTPKIDLTNTSLTQCDDNGDGISIFDLTKADAIIKKNNTTLNLVGYYESLANAQGNINPILNPTSYINNPAIQILFARVNNTFNCVNYAQLNLVIANNAIASQNPVLTCDADETQDGLYQFDLNAQVSSQVLAGLPTGMMVEYYLNTTDAISQKNPLPNIFKNLTANQQVIYARILNGADCYGIVPITLVVNAFIPSDFQDENAGICLGISINLSVSSGYLSYLWNTGATTNSIKVETSGNYSVAVTDVIGCKAIKKFAVTNSEVATITGAKVSDFAGSENSILLEFAGVGNYEFSLDGIIYQDNPMFIGVAPGNYLAYTRDKNGCGISAPFEIYVIDYPRFFTPNGDGYNDAWKIKNLDLFPNASLIVYDRYGKLVQEINAIYPSWNGTYQENDLPADDYWFTLNFGNGKIIKGHFSLKR